jgi:hypothetical protein
LNLHQNFEREKTNHYCQTKKWQSDLEPLADRGTLAWLQAIEGSTDRGLQAVDESVGLGAPATRDQINVVAGFGGGMCCQASQEVADGAPTAEDFASRGSTGIALLGSILAEREGACSRRSLAGPGGWGRRGGRSQVTGGGGEGYRRRQGWRQIFPSRPFWFSEMCLPR